MTMPPLPCPFCGSANISAENASDFVACLDCCARIGRIDHGSSANIEAWNRRAAIAAERERCAAWLRWYDGAETRRSEAISNGDHWAPDLAIAAHVPEAACGNIAAVPAQPVSLDQIQAGLVKAFGEPLARDDILLRRIAEGIHAAAPQAVPVPAWQPIETAPRGSGEDGPEMVNDPDYVAPPQLLLMTPDGMTVGAYDWYYHAGYGRGAEPGVPAWRQSLSSEPIYDATHWMPLPAAPKEQPHE